jgi:hypothetical protein
MLAPVTAPLAVSDLPSVTAYLSGLPHGIDSYPRAMVKGSVVRMTMGEWDFPSMLAPGALPEPVETLVRHPPGVSSWVPEVHHAVVVSAVFDARFRDAGGLGAFESWVRDGNRRLLRGPLYRVMFVVLSPSRVLSGAQQRWATFHRGSLLTVVKREERVVVARLTYPPHLFGDLSLRAFAGAFQAALESAGAKSPRVTTQVESPGAALYDAHWGHEAE